MISPLTILPVSGSIGGSPEIKANPLAFVATVSGTPRAAMASDNPGTLICSIAISIFLLRTTPSTDRKFGVDLARRVQRQHVDADGRARVPPCIAKDLNHQIRDSIHDL